MFHTDERAKWEGEAYNIHSAISKASEAINEPDWCDSYGFKIIVELIS